MNESCKCLSRHARPYGNATRLKALYQKMLRLIMRLLCLFLLCLPGLLVHPLACGGRRWQAAVDGRRRQDPQAAGLPDCTSPGRASGRRRSRARPSGTTTSSSPARSRSICPRLLHLRAGTRAGILQRHRQLHHRTLRRRQQAGRTEAGRRHERGRLVVGRSAPPPRCPRPGTDHARPTTCTSPRPRPGGTTRTTCPARTSSCPRRGW